MGIIKLMKKIKTVFIGGGFFLNQQYPWLIPLIDEYCKNKKINQIIFETYQQKIYKIINITVIYSKITRF